MGCFVSNVVGVKVLGGDNFHLPTYATVDSAGADIYADKSYRIEPKETVIVKTGLKVAIPKGFKISIIPRSGLALKKLLISNSPGTIDSDYRGEIGVIIHNYGDVPYCFNIGDRIAQMTIEPVWKIDFIVVSELPSTERGEGGFGSTGS